MYEKYLQNANNLMNNRLLLDKKDFTLQKNFLTSLTPGIILGENHGFLSPKERKNDGSQKDG
ncbi:MAG: hypothetical protein ABIG94_07040 [Pseudomonadota bacterium]